jgi:fluoride exporter
MGLAANRRWLADGSYRKEESSMRTSLAVGVAGAAGALARYGLDGLISRRAALFPWGTFVVNVTGAFALGLLFTVFAERITTPAWIRSGLLIGFIGAYTTFSTLTLETYRLFEERSVALALVNAVGSLAAGLVAVYAGVVVGRAV